MALRWDEGDNVPDSIKDKTPEQLAAEIEQANARSTAQATELEQARAQLARLDAGNGRQQQQQQQNVNEPPSVLIDEEAAFMHRQAPLAAGLMHTQAQLAVMRAEQSILMDPTEARIYRQYKSEVEEMFKRVPFQMQGMPESYLNCYAIVKGNHFKELKDMVEKRTGIFTEPAGDNPPAQAPPKDENLTAEEMKMCRRMHIDPEEFKKRRAAGGSVRMVGVV